MKRYWPIAAKFGGVGLLTVALSSWVGCAGASGEGAALAAAGQYTDALATYEQVVAEKPGTTDAWRAQLAIAKIQIPTSGTG